MTHPDRQLPDTAAPPVEVRSQDMEEVIGTPPNWLARYGTSLLLLSVVVLVFLLSVCRYPAVVDDQLTLTTIDPPRPLRAPRDFRIKLVNAHHNGAVEATQALIVAESEATFSDVWDLTEALNGIGSLAEQDLADFSIRKDWNLGGIQQAAYRFEEKQKEYNNLVERSLDGLTTRDLEERIGEQLTVVRRAQGRLGPLEDDDVRTRTSLTQAEEDFRQDRITAEELNEVRRRRNFARDRLKASRTVIREANFEIELLQAQIEANRSGLSGGTRERVGRELRAAFESLRATLDVWNRSYTLVSPIDGTVLLDQSIKPGAVVLRGDDVALVIPKDPGEMIGRMQLPVKGSAAIATGQRVMVRFAGYPYLEFGSVEGTVQAVDDLVTENAFAVTVSFPNGLVTTTGNRLKAKPLMSGEASIITDDQPLLWRFLDRE